MRRPTGLLQLGIEALRMTGKPPITVRWVDVNKCDGLNPKIRSRPVAREIRLKGKPLPHQLEQAQPLSMSDFMRFRGQAARANYLGLDRPDVIYAAKEVCRGMPSPTDLHQAALKRMVRYLRSMPRMVFEFDYQSATHIVAYADLGWLPTIQAVDVMWMHHGGDAPVEMLEVDSGGSRNEVGRGRFLRRSQGVKH